ncbi:MULTISPECIES: TetR/AcrR family transcriptional regulator [Rufibacter]|uniref:AcrR family transcriptional regulator n=1 Tax=Rufibacter quisquiliarum TaxID=1549639 RepID=A0A839GKJ5_9BACT|nr:MULTISPECIES: TetR/AcrR family transcriptional regulator [Rufibacter]MBA9075487.1 AcrR family transcriptional regulator [Rufibacter quisquiliarum]
MSFRDTILHEALVIFEQKGIEDISTETLLELLDISRGTLNEIAGSKKELVQECISHSIRVRQKVAEQIISEADHSLEALLQVLQLCLEEVYSFNHAFVYDLQVYYPQSWARLQLLMRLLTRNYLRPLIQQSKDQGYLQQDVDAELAARMFLNHMYGLLNPRLFPAFAFDYQELFKTMILNYIKGCATPQGQAHIDVFPLKAMAV